MRNVVWLLLSFGPLQLCAQELHESVRAARNAFDELDFGNAIVIAQQALTENLTNVERAEVYEVLGFAYGILDSASQAVRAFGELIVLAPDHEPDPNRFPPRLINLYAEAVGQVLVIRRLRVDSASFIAGEGSAPIRFEVSRPAWVFTRIVGPGYQAPIDSQLVAPGPVRVDWTGLDTSGAPVPAWEYQVVVTAREGRNQYQRPTTVRVSHASVDTLSHVVGLPGFTEQPEFEMPQRNWRPLAIAAVYTGVTSGASIALENSAVGDVRREIIGVSLATLVGGLVLSLRKPEPRPVQAAILHNTLVRQVIADRNAEIARENEQRRDQVRLTVVQSS